MGYMLKSDEVVLLEKNVYLKSKKHKLVITNKNLLFEKEKGLFNKKYYVVSMVCIDSIKMYKGNVVVKQKNKKLMFQTIDTDISFVCENIIDATMIKEKIIAIKTDANILKRTTKKVNKVSNIIKDVALLSSALIAIPVGIKTIYDNKDKIIDTFKSILNK